MRNSKILGTIGTLMSFVWFLLPQIGGAIAVVGSILLLLAIRQISITAEEPRIFRNYILAFIFFTATIILSSATFVVIFATGISNEFLESIFFSIMPFLIAVWLLSIPSAVFLRKSFSIIAEKTGVKLFRTAGNTFLISAILLITFLGFLILFIALIFQLVAFLSLPQKMKSD